jgi:hypothetical protein
MIAASKTWRRLKGTNQLPKVIAGIRFNDGIEVLARFELKAGPLSLTSYQTDAGTKNTNLTIPAYHLVKWLAQNWRAFLYEPRKLDTLSEAERTSSSRADQARFTNTGPISRPGTLMGVRLQDDEIKAIDG